MARGRPSREERALWRASMRDVTPLAPAPRAAPTDRDASDLDALPPPAAPAEAPRAPRPPLPPLAPGAAPGIDRATAEKLRRGRLPIEARLDLHGMTEAEAHRALLAFVLGAWRRDLRSLLVITGKGGRAPGSPGVLKRAVPRWLNEAALRPAVLAFAAAQPRDGGAGALYLLLRRRR